MDQKYFLCGEDLAGEKATKLTPKGIEGIRRFNKERCDDEWKELEEFIRNVVCVANT